MKYKLSYSGFLQTVIRYFDSLERAEQWARQVGVYRIAKIEKV